MITEKRLEILVALEKGKHSISTISKITKITYHHTHKVLKHFEEMNIVESIKSGRTCHIKLTKKGIYLLHLSKQLLDSWKIETKENMEKKYSK